MANKNKLMEKAQKFLQKGKLKDTIAVLNQVIEVDPTDYRVLLKKGELEQRVGDDAGAKVSYTQVAEQYSADGFYLKAIAIYKKILKLDSEEQQIHSKLAMLYRKLGLDSEAKKHLKVAAEYYKAKGFKTNYQEILSQLSELGETVADTDSQISIAEKMVNENGRDNALQHLKKVSQKAVESGNLAQLESITKKMDELQIQDVEIYISHANAYVGAGEPKKALQVIQRAFAIQPQNTVTLELLARCFQELSQPLKAVSVFNELEKIYDNRGDMKNLTRVKAELLRLMGPIKVEESADSKPSYEAIEIGESDEFVIEEVELASAPKTEKKPEPKITAKKPSETSLPKKESSAPKDPLPNTHKSIEANAQVNFEDFDDEEEQSFIRSDEKDANEVSFMNVFVDGFDANEETVYSNDHQTKKTGKETVVEKPPVKPAEKSSLKQSPPKPLSESTIFNKDAPSFEASDMVEKTTNDFDEDIFVQEMKETYDLDSQIAEVNFDDAVHDATVMDSSKATPKEEVPELIGFDQFYAGGGKEKSEISVNAEEFVSLEDLEAEGSSPNIHAQPEKVEIHDTVLTQKPSIPQKPVAPAKPVKKPTGPVIQHQGLIDNPVSAEIESSLDFSNLEMSEINLQVPASKEDQDFVSSMLDDSDSGLIQNQFNLDEKTMMDVQREFKESAKHEPNPNSDDNFFDLTSALKDEISEFEKSFGKSENDLEEEYLSPEEVILEFKKGVARTIDKNDFQTHYNLGVAYKEMGLLDEAISAFELASNNPDSRIDAISMIGICLAIKNDFERAIKLYQQVLPTMSYQDPKALGITYQMAEAYLELGRHTEAYKAFVKIKDVDPTFREVKTRVKELQFNLGIKDPDTKQNSGKIIVDLQERKKNKF